MFKRSFTLFEIIISIILISLVYYFAVSSFTNNTFRKKDNINLLNLKEELLKYEYNDNITVKCVDDTFDCFIFKDGVVEDTKIVSLFKEKPTVYTYRQNYETVEFPYLELEQLQRYDVVFQYSCKSNNRCSEYIVQTDDLVYVMNNIYKEALTFKYLNEVDDFFIQNIEKVKDAF
ncbi:MAG: hypothetical protein U9Q33_13330 [Campylobacterota bacterium]|nr:hypothetical protein [Campylobacterota bacterium]